MSVVLYVGPTGREIKRHSFSSGQTFNSCRFKYKQEKVLGIRRKDRSAAMEFGKAVEEAIQFFHANGLKHGSGVDEVKRIWLKHKDNQDLVYTAKDKSWQNLYVAGAQMLRLYEILLPSLPIVSPVFQISYAKEVFPGTTLAGLEDGGFVDMVSKAPWVHPLLPNVPVPKDSAHRVVGIDIKTGGAELSLTRGLVGMDPQLRRYRWLSSIETWAFLWFSKSVVDAFQRGTDVTVIEDGLWVKSGEKLVVYDVLSDICTLRLTTEADMEKIRAGLAEIKGKGSTDRKEQFMVQAVEDGLLRLAFLGEVTKMKIQFLAARISEEDAIETGELVAKEIVEIHAANEANHWPKSPSVRFPDTKCVYCSHRGICLNDKGLQEQLLVQITDTKVEAEENNDDSDFFGEDQ